MNLWPIALLLGLGAAYAWGSMSPQTRQKVLLLLNEMVEAAARQAQERDRQQRLALPAETGPAALPTSGQTPGRAEPPGLQSLFPSLSALGSPSATKPVMFDPDARFRQTITHPSVVLILGKRGSGKIQKFRLQEQALEALHLTGPQPRARLTACSRARAVNTRARCSRYSAEP